MPLLYSDRDMAQWVVAERTVSAFDCGEVWAAKSVNTIRVPRASTGVSHVEGGWGEGVDTSDATQTARFRRRVERDGAFAAALDSAAAAATVALRQAGTIDIVGHYFEPRGDNPAAWGDDDVEELPESYERTPPGMHVRAVLRDASPVPRAATCVSWQPGRTGVLGVAYCSRAYDAAAPSAAPLQSHLWQVSRPDRPLADLLARSAVSALAFAPSSTHLIGAGLASGRVCLFDVRAAPLPSSSSDGAPHCHSDPVGAVHWCAGLQGPSFVSVAADGLALWWDVRSLARPTSRAVIAAPVRRTAQASRTNPGGEGDGWRSEHRAASGGTSVAAAPLAGTGSALVGCENGAVVLAVRTEGTDDDDEGDAGTQASTTDAHTGASGEAATGAATAAPVDATVGDTSTMERLVDGHDTAPSTWGDETDCGGAHTGPVWSVCAHPQHARFFLSAGVWGVRLWSMSSRRPLLATAPPPAMLTAAIWSPHRPAVWYAARSDGTVEAWDALHSLKEPTLQVHVSDAPLCSLAAVDGDFDSAAARDPLVDGPALAVGDAHGSVNVLAINYTLSSPAPGEREDTARIFSGLQEHAAVAASHRARMAALWATPSVSEGSSDADVPLVRSTALARGMEALRERPADVVEREAEAAFEAAHGGGSAT